MRQEHQQMKEDWEKAGCTRTTGLKEGFFTIAQLVMALNAVKKAASGRSTLAEKFTVDWVTFLFILQYCVTVL